MEKRGLSVICAGLLLLTVSACQKKETVVSEVKPSAPIIKKDVSQPVKPGKPIFDDELEGFVLEDENSNAFAPATEETEEDINVDEQEVADDAWYDNRADQTRELGLKTAYFDFDKSEIRADQKPIFESNAKKVKDLVDHGSTVVVEGHACRYAGSRVYNLMLSEKRAKKAADFLVGKGIPANKLKTVGRGYEMCIVPEGTMEEQAPNRRVEFYVLD